MSTVTPECKCPYCGHKFDRAGDPTGDKMPHAEDFSICIECAGWLVFNEDLTVRAISAEEIAGMKVEERAELERVTATVRKL